MNLPVLAVNEVYASLLGDGPFVGAPATFIRLQGCPVGCAWCDVRHTWPVSARKEISTDEMLAKQAPSATWAAMTTRSIVNLVARWPQHHVITGGEPCAQPIQALTEALPGVVQLETSGTYPIEVDPRTFVTVSPKIGMAGGLTVLPQAIERADEIRMPVAGPADIERLLELLGKGADVYRDVVFLAPVDQHPEATDVCLEACMKRGWRLSIGAHKRLGLR